MRLDTERWFVLPLLIGNGLIPFGRLANARLFLRGELGFDLVDERHE